MEVITELDRRGVVAAYLTYDSAKKGKPLPDITPWEWTSADAVDEALHAFGYKCGILGGFLSWQQVALTVENLRNCAVVATISAALGSNSRDLRALESKGLLASWQPEGSPGWLGLANAGKPFSPAEPFLLRPSVRSEWPAKWYLEDGSGRATAIVANAFRYEDDSFVACGFLGTLADSGSTFMKAKFPELVPDR